MGPVRTVTFYVDFLSPYGYLASHKIDAIVARHGWAADWRIFLVGAAFKLTGAVSAGERSPLQQQYFLQDILRSAAFFEVPFQFPRIFGSSALPPSRAYWALYDRDPAAAKAFARAVYHAIFVEDRDLHDEAQTRRLLDAAGQDGAAITAWARSAEGKGRFRRETEAAIAAGAFGSPFMIAGGQSFWGADRLAQLDWWLGQAGSKAE